MIGFVNEDRVAQSIWTYLSALNCLAASTAEERLTKKETVASTETVVLVSLRSMFMVVELTTVTVLTTPELPLSFKSTKSPERYVLV